MNLTPSRFTSSVGTNRLGAEAIRQDREVNKKAIERETNSAGFIAVFMGFADNKNNTE